MKNIIVNLPKRGTIKSLLKKYFWHDDNTIFITESFIKFWLFVFTLFIKI